MLIPLKMLEPPKTVLDIMRRTPLTTTFPILIKGLLPFPKMPIDELDNIFDDIDELSEDEMCSIMNEIEKFDIQIE